MKLLMWGSIPARQWMTTTTNYLSASLAKSRSSPTSWVRCNSQARTINSFSTHLPRREIDQQMRGCGQCPRPLPACAPVCLLLAEAAVRQCPLLRRLWGLSGHRSASSIYEYIGGPHDGMAISGVLVMHLVTR